MKKNRMNILVTLNDHYMKPLRIMLESLFMHEKHPLDIYLFYSNVSEKNREHLKNFVRHNSRKSRLITVFVDENIFKQAPVFSYFTREMYYRLLCSRFIPKTEDRILYLDPDLLIRGEIFPLYEMDFQGKQIIGVEDYAIKHILRDKKEAIGFKAQDAYINSGVLLFNLKEMGEKFRLDDFIRLLDEYRETVSYPDQDAINLYFKDNILLADRIYNYNTGYGSVLGMLAHIFGFKKEKEEPVIVHFCGKSKPWQVDYYGKYFFEYYKYLKVHLNKKGKLLFFFKPCYVMAKLMNALVGKCCALCCREGEE